MMGTYKQKYFTFLLDAIPRSVSMMKAYMKSKIHKISTESICYQKCLEA